MSAFKDHRPRLTLHGALNGRFSFYLPQRDQFPFAGGASLTCSAHPSLERRPHLMEAQSEEGDVFPCPLLTDHSYLLSPHVLSFSWG